ncbi:hypothetical protein GCM10020000_85540 [Streptomyces olivoverticillatus]
MTAAHVSGIPVLEDQPARSSISRTGVTVFYEQTRELLLENGQVVYGCVHCDYTSTNQNSIRPHLKVHKPKAPALAKPHKEAPRTPLAAPANRTAPHAHVPAPRPANDAPRAAGDLASLNLGQLVERAQQCDQLRRERDTARREAADWKQRALDERLRMEGWKDRAVKAEGAQGWKERALKAEQTVAAVRQMVQL